MHDFKFNLLDFITILDYELILHVNENLQFTSYSDQYQTGSLLLHHVFTMESMWCQYEQGCQRMRIVWQEKPKHYHFEPLNFSTLDLRTEKKKEKVIKRDFRHI